MKRLNDLRKKAEPYATTLLRVVVGIVMVAHGWDKLTNIDQWTDNLTALGVPAPGINVWLATAGELGGGLGLLVGLLTPVAAFGVASTMAVAILSAHIKNGLLARDNGFEYPLTLLSAGVFFMAHGAGPFSLDALVAKMRKKDA